MKKLIDHILETKYLDKVANQVYNRNIHVYLSTKDYLNTFISLRRRQWNLAIQCSLPKWFNDHMSFNLERLFDDFKLNKLIHSSAFDLTIYN
jgi:hypothetical protein